MICPMCATTVPVQSSSCPSCHEALSEYAAVWYYADTVFNEGVSYLRRGQHAEAMARFGEVIHARPDDAQALRAWAYAADELGLHDQAAGALLDAMQLEPGPDLDAQYAAALAASSAQPAAPSAAPRPPQQVRVVRVGTSRAARKKKR